MAVLTVEAVSKTFGHGREPRVRALDGVSLEVREGETFAIIGESGSGKSTLARIALGLLACDAGCVMFEGKDVFALGARRRRALRSEMSMVFQEPLGSLNPRMRVADIVSEPLVIHRRHQPREWRRKRTAEVLELVRLGASLGRRYPWELSGGQQQRVGIARALVTEPRLVVLDEPTSALDLGVQAQILSLLSGVQRELGVAYLFITHNLDVAEYISQRVAVMAGGRVVESGATETVLAAPQHAYTKALCDAGLDVEYPPWRTSTGRAMGSEDR